MELALLIGLVLINGAWIVYLDRRDKRQRDQLSELTTRLQHPQLVNPRALEEGLPPPPDLEAIALQQGERELAGQVFNDGLPERLRAQRDEDE